MMQITAVECRLLHLKTLPNRSLAWSLIVGMDASWVPRIRQMVNSQDNFTRDSIRSEQLRIVYLTLHSSQLGSWRTWPPTRLPAIASPCLSPSRGKVRPVHPSDDWRLRSRPEISKVCRRLTSSSSYESKIALARPRQRAHSSSTLMSQSIWVIFLWNSTRSCPRTYRRKSSCRCRAKRRPSCCTKRS